VRDVTKAFEGASEEEEDAVPFPTAWSILFVTLGDSGIGEKMARQWCLELGNVYPAVNVGWMEVGLGEEVTKTLVDPMEYGAEGRDEGEDDEEEGVDSVSSVEREGYGGDARDARDEEDSRRPIKRRKLFPKG